MSSKRNLDAARSIPVVDFGAMSLGNKDLTSGDETAVKELIQQMLLAFSTVGFVYITRHGMSQETVRLSRASNHEPINRGMGALLKGLSCRIPCYWDSKFFAAGQMFMARLLRQPKITLGFCKEDLGQIR